MGVTMHVEVGDLWEISTPSFQFCCGPKTALKQKQNLVLKKIYWKRQTSQRNDWLIIPSGDSQKKGIEIEKIYLKSAFSRSKKKNKTIG